MALCYIAVACNGTRDNIYGVYPTREAALECLKRALAGCDVGDDEVDPANATTIEELDGACDARIVEIADGGEEISIEIHEW